MKCVKLKGARDLQIATIKKPVSHDGSVIIKVKACGICGSDLHYFEGGAPLELIMGHEFAGVVVDPGSRDDLKVGDRVTGLHHVLSVKLVKVVIPNFVVKLGIMRLDYL